MKGLIFDIDDTLYSRQDLFVKAAENVRGISVSDPREFVRVFYAKSDLNTAELEAGLITTRECNGRRFEETYKELGISFREGDGVKTADAYLELQSHMSLSPSMRGVLTKLSEEPGISLGVLTAGELYEKSAELSHHDPFDRILIAQTKHENYSLLSHDVKLKDYNEDCLILV